MYKKFHIGVVSFLVVGIHKPIYVYNSAQKGQENTNSTLNTPQSLSSSSSPPSEEKNSSTAPTVADKKKANSIQCKRCIGILEQYDDAKKAPRCLGVQIDGELGIAPPVMREFVKRQFITLEKVRYSSYYYDYNFSFL